MTLRWLRPRSASPGSEGSVETQPAGEVAAVVGHRPDLPAASRYPHPLLTRPDPWAAQHHDGSPDLVTHPASITELHFASRVFHGEVEALRSLRSVAQSAERASAVLRLTRREAQAQGVLTRATGGET